MTKMVWEWRLKKDCLRKISWTTSKCGMSVRNMEGKVILEDKGRDQGNLEGGNPAYMQ